MAIPCVGRQSSDPSPYQTDFDLLAGFLYHLAKDLDSERQSAARAPFCRFEAEQSAAGCHDSHTHQENSMTFTGEVLEWKTFKRYLKSR